MHMKTTPLNLRFSKEAREYLESCLEPGLTLGLVGQGHEWVVCLYDEPWINKNLEKIQAAGNPYFYKTSELTLGIMSTSDAQELQGTTIQLKNGRLHRE